MKQFSLLAALMAIAYAGSAAAAEYDYYQTTGVRPAAHAVSFGGGCGCAPEAACCAPEPTCCAPNGNGCTDNGCCGDAGCTSGCGGCDSCCTSLCSRLFGNCCLGDAYELYTPGECSQFDMGGWVQLGYHTQGVNGNGTGLFNSYPNRVQLQQGWLWAERSTDTGGCGWDWGFRVDAVYGTDGPDTQAFGSDPSDWDNPWDYGSAYGAAIPQLYGTVAYNDLTIKMGHFFTIIGYEVVAAPDNFFYSHAFTMYNAEPFTHTGVLAEYAHNDCVTLWGGWTAGWDTGFTQEEGGSNFLGGVSLALTDNVTFIYATTIGDFGLGTGGSSNGYSHSIVVDVALSDRLNYVFQSDYVDEPVFVGGDGDILGVNQYLLYSINDCWGVGARVEWYNDPDFGSDVYAGTLGLNYRPHANFVLRPEVRIDDYAPANGAGAGGADLRDTTSFGIDAILTF